MFRHSQQERLGHSQIYITIKMSTFRCLLRINNYSRIILSALYSYKVKRIATDDCVIKKQVNDDYFFTTECFGQVPYFHEQYRF